MRYFYCTSLPAGFYYFIYVPEWFSFYHLIAQIVWIIVLFYLLGKAADDYFCATLQLIADYLRMSDEVAGMTILALGNGSPDVSSTLIALKNNDYGIAIGELLGAGLFVSCVVVGVVGLSVGEFELERFSFFRDLLFYLVGSTVLALVLWFEEIYWYLAILPLLYYILYVIGALSYHYWRVRKNAQIAKRNPVGFSGFGIFFVRSLPFKL